MTIMQPQMHTNSDDTEIPDSSTNIPSLEKSDERPVRVSAPQTDEVGMLTAA